MPLELTSRTAAGTHLVELAESLGAAIAASAPGHDRDGTFPVESFEQIRSTGYLAAPIPTQLGGMGVTSVHDVLVAQSRLARGDASLTLGINMHFAYLLNVVRRWQIAAAAGDERRIGGLSATLEQIARDRTSYAAAITEPRQDLTRPATTATRTDDGWLVTGRKAFSTMSSVADVLYTAVTFVDSDGRERYGYALVPRETDGVVVHGDWDALGMRASGSHSITFDGVRLPASALRGGFPVGDAVQYIERNLSAGLFHAAAALGIAESADAAAGAQLASRGELDHYAQGLVAENVVDLAASRAVFSRAAGLIDDSHELHATATQPDDELIGLFAQAQSAKSFIGDAAVRIVDRALALSGGAGYVNGSPLARAYRDVRATSFMHPLGANRAGAFLAEYAAGRAPSLT